MVSTAELAAICPLRSEIERSSGGNCDKAPIEGQPPDRAKSSMLGRGFSKKGKPGLRQRFSRQLFVPSYLPRENQ